MRRFHSSNVSPIEIRPDESFVELETPPPTPGSAALAHSLQPLLNTTEIEVLLLEEERAKSGALSRLTERADADSLEQEFNWPPPPTPSFAVDATFVGRGLPAPPPRPNLRRLDIQPDRRLVAPSASVGSRRPSASRTAPGSSVSSPARSPSALAMEAMDSYSKSLVLSSCVCVFISCSWALALLQISTLWRTRR